MKQIVFGEFYFKTKKAATEEVRGRINKYEAGDTLSCSDQMFFEALFELHSEKIEKVGVGIKNITVEMDFHKNRCLYIHRIDGSDVEISWVHCIQPASKKTIVSTAFRRAIKDHIMSFKVSRLSGGYRCPVLDIPLNYENSHVAYTETSFDLLLQGFLEGTGNFYETIELVNPEPQDKDQRGILKSSELSALWQIYHEKNVKLTLMSAEANLRK